jgi:hypothetical protein
VEVPVDGAVDGGTVKETLLSHTITDMRTAPLGPSAPAGPVGVMGLPSRTEPPTCGMGGTTLSFAEFVAKHTETGRALRVGLLPSTDPSPSPICAKCPSSEPV